MTWADFYRSDLQSLLSLQVLPFAFLVYRVARSPNYAASAAPEFARFVDRFTLIVALETLLDPVATGPLLAWLGWKDSFAASAVGFLFVYLGDFRVLALILGIALAARGIGRAIGSAAGLSLVVPILAFGSYAVAELALGELPEQVLWFVYEAGFLALAIVLARHWLPSRGLAPPVERFLADVAAYAAVYYALWATADVLITFASLDAGWAIRIVPNQLYYAVFVPFVYVRFFGTGDRSRTER